MLNSCVICNVEAKIKGFGGLGWVFFLFPNYTKAGKMGIALIVMFDSGLIAAMAQRRKTTKLCLFNDIICLDTILI